MNILEVQNLTKSFGKFDAVKDVTVGFEKGKITALIGPNGAGKTTFLRLLSGELSPTEGKIIWKDHEITGSSFAKIARKGVSRCFQVAYVFDSLSVMDNLRVAGRVKRIPKKALDNKCGELLGKVGMLSQKDLRVGSLPHGSKRMVELCMSFIQEPELLLSDEIAAGLSDAEIAIVDRLIKEKCESCTIVVVEHRLEFVFGLCHRVIAMHNGGIIAQGTSEEVKSNSKVRQVYWGE